MYQFVEDLKEEQYKNFVQAKKLSQKNSNNRKCIYLGVAKDRKLVACCKVELKVENRKNIFVIPLGIQTIIENEELYVFFQKYISATAKKYGVHIIKLYSHENPILSKIGYKRKKENQENYLPLKMEKSLDIPNYFQIDELNTERKRNRLKELKLKNKDLFLFNNISFFTLQLDLYTYLDTLKDKKERKLVQELISEIGDSLILESCSIEYLNDDKVQYIDYETYSSILEDKRKNILFQKLQEQLVQKGIHKLFLPKNINLLNLKEESIIEYEYSINTFTNLIKRRG